MIKLKSRRRLAAILAQGIISVVLSYSAVAAPKYESGVLTNNQPNATTWRSATFATPFTAPPVVVLGTPTQGDTQQLTTRVRNVTTTGFEYQLDEWDYLDGIHGSETFSYLALEPGVHTIGGVVWHAGRTAAVTRAGQTVAFTSSFAAAPVVLAQVESTANTKALSTRVSLATTTNFNLKLITQESDTAALSGESVGWIAIAPGTGTVNGASFVVARTGVNVTQAWKAITFGGSHRQPAFFSQGQTVNGVDPFTIRQRNLTTTGVEIFLEEEQSAGTEINHGAEDVGYLVLGESLGELRAKLELGDITDSQASATAWHSETFSQAHTSPVVVFGPVTQKNGEPVQVRVRNVTSIGFEWQFDEWDYQDGSHPEETVHYIVAEQGTYLIAGLLWEFGRSTGVTHTAANKTFTEAFPAAPVVLAQVATINETSAVSPRLSNISATGFTVQLEEEQAANQTHAGETVHYVAVQKGSGRLVSNQHVIEAGASAVNVTQAFRTLGFARKLADPFVIADVQTRNDTDPVVVRQRNLGVSSVDVRAQEEVSSSSDVTHAAETVGYLIVSGSVDLDEDGLPDSWETSLGLNPNDPADAALDPDGDGISNLNEYAYGTNPNTFDSGGVITVGPAVTEGYEKEGTSARFTISRTGSDVPVTVTYALSGRATAPGQAGADYATKTNAGAVLTGSVTIPFEASSVDVVIEPTLDTLDEYPETVVLTVTANTRYAVGPANNATVFVSDASPIPANEQLFVALL
ncbi:MAG TPA: thrombospondin type 3 repeat-containing protein, partial [Candidatus Saccharimonadia bacterium]|nr:thrombospondin type 3 repeat-containing protein [Candidatus Saccharimonadia bacterium]